jgi:hypothetical protein
MRLATLRNRVFGPQAPRPPARQRRRVPLLLERLEDRSLPSAYTAASVADLVADIRAANQHGGSNTITLAANTPFTLTAVDNTTDGATGLPVITANDILTVAGSGDTLTRSTATGTPAFRLFDVAGSGSLTLNNLTLQGGLAFGAGVAAEGGALYNQGTLLLNSVTVQNNSAQGSPGQIPDGNFALGGGIVSNGALTLQSCIIQNNQAVGGQGGRGFAGGGAQGGGVFVAGGTASLNNVVLSSNTALGGAGGDGVPTYFNGDTYEKLPGGPGGNGLGGGLFAAGGTVSLRNCTVDYNVAQGGAGGQSVDHSGSGKNGQGFGGGLYIVTPALVSLDAFTLAHVTHNQAATDKDIDGSYTTSP